MRVNSPGGVAEDGGGGAGVDGAGGGSGAANIRVNSPGSRLGVGAGAAGGGGLAGAWAANMRVNSPGSFIGGAVGSAGVADGTEGLANMRVNSPDSLVVGAGMANSRVASSEGGGGGSLLASAGSVGIFHLAALSNGLPRRNSCTAVSQISSPLYAVGFSVMR